MLQGVWVSDQRIWGPFGDCKDPCSDEGARIPGQMNPLFPALKTPEGMNLFPGFRQGVPLDIFFFLQYPFLILLFPKIQR